MGAHGTLIFFEVSKKFTVVLTPVPDKFSQKSDIKMQNKV